MLSRQALPKPPSFSRTRRSPAMICFFRHRADLPKIRSAVVYLNVMANDGGGTKTTLWSLDDGSSSLTYATIKNGGSGVSAPTDLLIQDTARAEEVSTDYSTHGAHIWISTLGTVGYDASTLSAGFRAQLQALEAGQ